MKQTIANKLCILKTLNVFTICILLLSTNSAAQQVSATVDRNKILIGEPITLTIKINDVLKNKNVIKWGILPDTINHLEIIERGKIDTFDINGLWQYQQNLTLTSFDSGSWIIPALTFIVADGKTLATKKETNPINIDVLPVDVSLLVDYHDIKEIIEPAPQSKLFYIILITSIVALLIIVVILYIRRKKTTKAAAKTAMPLVNYDSTIAALNKLAEQEWYNKQQHKKHYEALIDICKTFASYQLGYNVHSLTTEEWMIKLTTSISTNHVHSFMQLLRLSDVVKFAKFIPDNVENEASISIAKEFIMTIATKTTNHAD
jgi:hypothetical protein